MGLEDITGHYQGVDRGSPVSWRSHQQNYLPSRKGTYREFRRQESSLNALYHSFTKDNWTHGLPCRNGRASDRREPTGSPGNISQDWQRNYPAVCVAYTERLGGPFWTRSTMVAVWAKEALRGGMGLDLGPESNLNDQRGRGSWKGESRL